MTDWWRRVQEGFAEARVTKYICIPKKCVCVCVHSLVLVGCVVSVFVNHVSWESCLDRIGVRLGFD